MVNLTSTKIEILEKNDKFSKHWVGLLLKTYKNQRSFTSLGRLFRRPPASKFSVATVFLSKLAEIPGDDAVVRAQHPPGAPGAVFTTIFVISDLENSRVAILEPFLSKLAEIPGDDAVVRA